jgi:hypothetical protein
MFTRLSILSALVALVLVPAVVAEDVAGLKPGSPQLQSATALAFGPDGVLFVADPKAKMVYAIGTGDTKRGEAKDLKVEKIDNLVAALLGTTADQILINDMKVNPASGTIYMSVARGKGPLDPGTIVRVGADGKPAELPMKDVPCASVKIDNESKNKRNPVAITSMAFHKGELYVAGMTTDAWESNLKAIPFPFSESATKGAGVQIYHGAHGKYETQAPIQTFMAYDIAGQTHLLASYTCTPLVKFPVEEIKKGDKVKGTTVAELGNRNRPLDIIAYSKDGKDFALIANSARGVMKVKLEGVDKIEEITTPVRGGNGTAGLAYDTIKELDGTLQLDKLSDTTAVVLRRGSDGLTVQTVALP